MATWLQQRFILDRSAASLGSTLGPLKTELIRRHGPWRTLEEVELATLAYVDWFNHRRLHGQIGNLPPAELEATYYRQLGQAAVA